MNGISTINLTMSSREIAEFTGKSLSHVHRDIVSMIADLPEDDPEKDHVRYDTDERGYMACVHLPKELSITLVSGYSTPIRRAIVKRWQELEAKQIPAAPVVPTTLSGALRLAADQAEQIEQQQAALALAAPKVEFVDRYVESTGNKGFREVAKLLGANEASFREFLLTKGVMYRLAGSLTPMAQHLDAGRFVVKAGANEDSGHAFTQAKFTTKGVAWIAGLWMEWKLEQGDTEE